MHTFPCFVFILELRHWNEMSDCFNRSVELEFQINNIHQEKWYIGQNQGSLEVRDAVHLHGNTWEIPPACFSCVFPASRCHSLAVLWGKWWENCPLVVIVMWLLSEALCSGLFLTHRHSLLPVRPVFFTDVFIYRARKFFPACLLSRKLNEW